MNPYVKHIYYCCLDRRQHPGPDGYWYRYNPGAAPDILRVLIRTAIQPTTDSYWILNTPGH